MVYMNKSAQDRAGYLYLFRQEGTDCYKIGSTRNLKLRLRTINGAMPYKVVLVESYPLTDHLRKIEIVVHEMLKDYRLNGEWFKFEDLDAWHKVVEQLPLIETLQIFKHTKVPNVGRPRKYKDEDLKVSAMELVDVFGISRQHAHQLLKRHKEELAQEFEN